MSSDNGAAPSVEDRARALLADARVEIIDLENRKAALNDERDEAIRQVREEFARKAHSINAELAMIRRLERALDPDIAARMTQGPRSRRPTPKERNWTPAQDQQDAVLRALADGHEIVSSIADQVDVSHTTVKYSLDAMRESGLVRLAGQGANNARLYRPTPKGEQRLAELRS